MSDAPQYEFSVRDPHKVGSGIGAYWSYQVHAKTTIGGQTKEGIVARRYNDFMWLRGQLISRYPGCIVPPLPAKVIEGSIEKVSRKTEPTALVQYRARSMRKFLVRVAAHAHLRKSDALREFLELNESDFKKRAADGSKSYLTDINIPHSLKDVFRKGPGKTEQELMWEKRARSLSEFGLFMTYLRDKVDAVAKDRKAFVETETELAKSFTHLADVEETHEGATSLTRGMRDFGTYTDHNSLQNSDHAGVEVQQISESISYYIGMTDSAIETIRALQKLLFSKAKIEHRISRLIADRDALSDGPARVKIGIDLQTAEEDLSSAAAVISRFDRTLNEDLARFQQEKAFDMKQLITTWTQIQRDYGVKDQKRWELITPSIEAIG
eukprot:TRINITY_DN1554_c0_g5_i1.p1 TRINITY_DN1554_c0_g5~~TRINITY_DN1554_c0_g5_i1.p1  ORF type:complete len:382 (+),score=66.91 TRINITY_DN1554_c0_g5_i1:42-1187(+)